MIDDGYDPVHDFVDFVDKVIFIEESSRFEAEEIAEEILIELGGIK